MPEIVTLTTVTDDRVTGACVIRTDAHTVLRITPDYYVVVGATVPDSTFLADVLPAGEWVTEWDESDDGLLIVHITRGE